MLWLIGSAASCPTDAFLYRIDVTVLLYSASSTTPYRVRDKAVVILVEMFIFKIFAFDQPDLYRAQGTIYSVL